MVIGVFFPLAFIPNPLPKKSVNLKLFGGFVLRAVDATWFKTLDGYMNTGNKQN